VTDPSICGFGKWYYSYKNEFVEIDDLFKALEAPHKKLHITGEEVIKAMQKGDFKEAEKISLQIRDGILPELMKIYDPFKEGLNKIYDVHEREFKAEIALIITKIFSILIAAIIVSILLAYKIITMIKKPLIALSEYAHKVGGGEYNLEKIDVNTTDEYPR